MENIVVCIFGSSIIEGILGMDNPQERWYNLLHAKLTQRFPGICFSIVNAGVGGESTRECMLRYERDVLAHNLDYFLFMLGGNNNDYTRPERIVPLEELEGYLKEITETLPAKTQPIGVVIGPVIDEQHWCYTNPEFIKVFEKTGKRLNALLDFERELFRKFIVEQNWPSLDLYTLFDEKRHEYLMTDGIHLNKEGNALFAEKIFGIMEKLINDRKK